MNLFGNNKKDKGDSSSSPVVSEKSKESAGLLKRTVNKVGDILHKKFGSTKHTTDTAGPMSNTEYLGEIYKMLVQNRDDLKLEREQQSNKKEENDSQEQKRHKEIIRALTLRRQPKPKRVVRREKKAEEK
jgi:CRISPR/Cas system-associated protein Cas5 (RAMP superfamily)